MLRGEFEPGHVAGFSCGDTLLGVALSHRPFVFNDDFFYFSSLRSWVRFFQSVILPSL